jgi:hypothetical protein
MTSGYYADKSGHKIFIKTFPPAGTLGKTIAFLTKKMDTEAEILVKAHPDNTFDVEMIVLPGNDHHVEIKKIASAIQSHFPSYIKEFNLIFKYDESSYYGH